QDHLGPGKDLMIYELDELDCLADSMRDLLADRPRWEAMQKAAYETAAAGHTWAHRAEVIDREILCKIV
ncbi:MAG: glycosyltransferase, partial [Eubacterium sp.]|nr:glycosyltransferase [Eubacterium sp.]